MRDLRDKLEQPELTLFAGDVTSPVEYAHLQGRSFCASVTRSEQKSAGQFMTPPKSAEIMAERIVTSMPDKPRVRILEPSAGAGVLLAAVVEALLRRQQPPQVIEVMVFEQDQRLIRCLRELCRLIGDHCAQSGLTFTYSVRNEDFLLSDVALSRETIDDLIVIANPPYFKINKETDRRARFHSYAVYGQPNAYGLFMACTARLLGIDSRWCFIVPRSWMNGQYFKAVRCTISRHLELKRVHLFESRRESFSDDEVLQETVIVWADNRTLKEAKPSILFSRSQGATDLRRAMVEAIHHGSLTPSDVAAGIQLPYEESNLIQSWTSNLATFDMKVSTGPIVAFRFSDQIHDEPVPQSVPLLWMQHVSQQQVIWPLNRTSEHVRQTSTYRWALIPNKRMVLVRRFSPKEDLRRITCAPYLGTLEGDFIGLENHLNYIHRPTGTMSTWEVRGLSTLLASTLVDNYLRAVAGSTQINAHELRTMPLPPLATIESIGRRISSLPSLEEIDEVVNGALRRGCTSRIAA